MKLSPEGISNLTAGTYSVEVNNQPFGPSVGQSIITINESTVPSSTAISPEPSSIALLGTGMVGLVGVIRKRLS